MKYYSEMANDLFNTVEELQAAEEAIKQKELEKERKLQEEKEKQEKLKEEREVRAKEVEAAFQKAKDAQDEANKILRDFCKDFGAFHYSAKGDNVFPFGRNSLVDFILNRF